MSLLLANRAIDKVDSVAPFPPIIEDGNTFGFYDYLDLSSLTLDASNYLSGWKDTLGVGIELFQGVGSQQALRDNDGVYFDGLNDVIYSVFSSLIQPTYIYLVFRQRGWINGRNIFDGGSTNYGMARQSGTVNHIQAYAGALLPTAEYPLDEFGILQVLFNGANSEMIINDNVPVVGNAGTRNMNALTVGGGYINRSYSEIQVKGVLIRRIIDTAQDKADIYNYLKSYYSV